MNYQVAAFPDHSKKVCKILCPLCGRVHVHGCGEGPRSPHCLSEFMQQGGTYDLVLVSDPFPTHEGEIIDARIKHNQDVLLERKARNVTPKGSMKPDDFYRARIAALVQEARILNREYVDREMLRRAFPGNIGTAHTFPLGVRQAW